MKTKTLILTAALSVAGLASSQAQNEVYSSNAVGYVNLTVQGGVYSLLNNPLDAADNTVAGLLSTAPNGTQVLKWNGAGFDSSILAFGTWSDPSMTLAPGEGFFIQPGGSAEVTLTFVGEVMQGTAENPLSNALASGFSLVGSQVPQAGTATELDLTDDLANGSQILQWNGSGYDSSILAFGAWSPSDPSIDVGEGFFVNTATATSWDRIFSVN
jgi:hypothetical protein